MEVMENSCVMHGEVKLGYSEIMSGYACVECARKGYFLEPINEEIIAAVKKGNGEISSIPPSQPD